MIDARQWDALCLLIEEAWPGKFDDRAAKAWHVLLDGYDAHQVGQAIRALLARGGTFRPSVAELTAEIRRDPGKPTFAEACVLIFGRGGVLRARTQVRKASWDQGERDRLDEEAAWQRAGELHPLIGQFVRRQGLERLRRMDLDDPEYGAARRKLLSDQWEEFVDAEDNRDIAQLASGDRRGELARFDPLAALGAGPVAGAPAAEIERLAS